MDTAGFSSVLVVTALSVVEWSAPQWTLDIESGILPLVPFSIDKLDFNSLYLYALAVARIALLVRLQCFNHDVAADHYPTFPSAGAFKQKLQRGLSIP